MKKVWLAVLVPVFCLLLAGNVVAYSGLVSRTISVNFLPLKYYFDTYEKVAPSDKTGFIYNGTTYVPLRWLCESLGQEVSYDGANYAIWVGRQPSGTVVKLSELQRVPAANPGYEWVYEPTGVRLFGESFNEAYTIRGSCYRSGRPSTYTYLLDGEYTRCECYFGVIACYTDHPGSSTLIVKGDGTELYRVTKTTSERAEPVAFDVTGVLQITFEVYSETDMDYGLDSFIADATFER